MMTQSPSASPASSASDSDSSTTSTSSRGATRNVRPKKPRRTLFDENLLIEYHNSVESIDDTNAATSASSLSSAPLSIPKERPQRKIFIETYGCQMNHSDSLLILSILSEPETSPYKEYVQTTDLLDADVILLNTCAVRDNAEQKIWTRLRQIKALLRSPVSNGGFGKPALSASAHSRRRIVGVLGCMAERLKTKFLEEDLELCDIIVGPDRYNELPKLLEIAEEGHKAISLLLSSDDLYSDLTPTVLAPSTVSAFVTITRGCDNLCSFCVVPFVRGREKSRSPEKILAEIRQMVEKKNVKEITLLGQNVNSYLWREGEVESLTSPATNSQGETKEGEEEVKYAEGFSTVYKPKLFRPNDCNFVKLMDSISREFPDTRLRFTSPHPKDFQDELIDLFASRPNIAKQIHLPLQSGSDAVLDRMRRGYTHEAYIRLADKMRSTIDGLSLSTDVIAGFCGETEKDHRQSIAAFEHVQFENAFMFAYSMREKTFAHRNFEDDVPQDVKLRRLSEIIQTFRRFSVPKNAQLVGGLQLALIEGASRKNKDRTAGRTDGGQRVVVDTCRFDPLAISSSEFIAREERHQTRIAKAGDDDDDNDHALRTPSPISQLRQPHPGEFIVTFITGSSGHQTLYGIPLFVSSIQEFSRLSSDPLLRHRVRSLAQSIVQREGPVCPDPKQVESEEE